MFTIVYFWYRNPGVGHTGVGWVRQGWGWSYTSGVGHTEVGWGLVGHTGVGWGGVIYKATLNTLTNFTTIFNSHLLCF